MGLISKLFKYSIIFGLGFYVSKGSCTLPINLTKEFLKHGLEYKVMKDEQYLNRRK